ncbi:hypothetical protein C8J57DRAFT_1225689 [Mycena rebaudengoi]|nr:hypothetical protein C8J57DRAFT_1225689 [Mycena rebaudengoi]
MEYHTKYMVLVLEVGDSLGSPWKVPQSLLPLGKIFSAQGVKYMLAAQIYSSYTVKRGESAHFIARYVTPDSAKIFDYDGMQHDGHAKHRRRAKLAQWMSGPSDKLLDLPTGYRLLGIVYHLEGGVNAQQVFFAEQCKCAPWGLQLKANPTSNLPFARFAQLVPPNLTQMTGDQRAEWASVQRQAQSVEYQRDPSEPEKPLHSDDKVTETGRFQRDFIVMDDSDAASTQNTDWDSLDELILGTIESVLLRQSKRRHSVTASDSSNSQTPCPINCYGCGEVSDGDDGPQQVQCSSCGFWSHFRCQPEHDELLLLPRGIVMLPDPRVKDEWRGEHVLWYPAQFLKHHPGIPRIEFEFRYLECIEWPLTDAELMGPSRYYTQDRASCEEMLKVELRPEQIGKIRWPTFCKPNPARNHPLIAIFDAALDPLTKLLALFPDEHSVVSAFNVFFSNFAWEDDEPVDEWMEEPVKELAALMAGFCPWSWRCRVLTVGRVMLQLLAIQHELEEPLNLNGDTFEELREGSIQQINLEASEAFRTMLVATKPKQLTHKKYWDREAFGEFALDLYDAHTVFDPSYRPNMYRRITGHWRLDGLVLQLISPTAPRMMKLKHSVGRTAKMMKTLLHPSATRRLAASVRVETRDRTKNKWWLVLWKLHWIGNVQMGLMIDLAKKNDIRLGIFPQATKVAVQ